MAVDIYPGTNSLQYTHFASGINLPLIATLALPITVFARIKLNEAPGVLGASIFKIDRIPPGLGGNFFYHLLGINSSRFAFAHTEYFGGASGASVSLTSLDIGTWYSVSGVWRSETFRQVRLNAVAGPSNTVFKAPTFMEGVLIGASHTSSDAYNRPLTACIQDLVVWKRELTDEEFADAEAANSEDIITIHPTDIVFHMPLLDEASATDAFEYTTGSPVAITINEVGSSGDITTCVDSPELPDEPVESECGTEDEADAAQECAIIWPCDLVPQDVDVEVVLSTVSPGRSLSSREQVVQPDAGHWRIGLIGIRVWKNEILLWREIESTLNGRNGTCCVPFYDAPLSSTPIIANAGADYPIGVMRIGVLQTAGAPIRNGMHFSAGERGYVIERVFGTDDDGVTSVRIWPPLRDAILVNDDLDFNTPRVRCRLERDDGMNINLELLEFAKPSVTFVEDV